jgi:hypothetical protein
MNRGAKAGSPPRPCRMDSTCRWYDGSTLVLDATFADDVLLDCESDWRADRRRGPRFEIVVGIILLPHRHRPSAARRTCSPFVSSQLCSLSVASADRARVGVMLVSERSGQFFESAGAKGRRIATAVTRPGSYARRRGCTHVDSGRGWKQSPDSDAIEAADTLDSPHHWAWAPISSRGVNVH